MMLRTHQRQRRGAAAVEFAVIAPIFILLLFGIIEFGRAIMVKQIMVNASREGARQAIVEGATAASVRASVVDYLQRSSVTVTADMVTVNPDPAAVTNHQGVTVDVTVPFQNVSWVPPFIYHGDLTAATTMRSERFN